MIIKSTLKLKVDFSCHRSQYVQVMRISKMHLLLPPSAYHPECPICDHLDGRGYGDAFEQFISTKCVTPKSPSALHQEPQSSILSTVPPECTIIDHLDGRWYRDALEQSASSKCHIHNLLQLSWIVTVVNLEHS